MVYDTIILGSGVSGLTSAIYLGRAGRSVIVVEGHQDGGQLMTTPDIENFPSYISISGAELMAKMKEHAKAFGAEFIRGSAKLVSKGTEGHYAEFAVDLDEFGGNIVLVGKSVIVATGNIPKKLGLHNEEELTGQGISYCATCDGFFYRGKDVVVVGGGETAFEEALFLTKFARKVRVLVRGKKARASKVAIDRFLSQPNATVEYGTEIIHAHKHGNGQVEALVQKDGFKEVYRVDGIFVAIGSEPIVPNFNYLHALALHYEHNTIQTSRNNTETNIVGMFACGDVTDHRYKQAIVASGSGAKAGIDCDEYLTVREYFKDKM